MELVNLFVCLLACWFVHQLENIQPRMESASIIIVMDREHGSTVSLSTTNKMQRCIILFIIVKALHVSNGLSAHHQELRPVPNSSMLAVAANKFDKYPMLNVQI
jgi:hypothetical protein